MISTSSAESVPADQLEELAYFHPGPCWLAQEGSWIDSLLLFFDGVAIMLPDYKSGQQLIADPSSPYVTPSGSPICCSSPKRPGLIVRLAPSA